METRSKRRRLLQSYVSSQWPDLPAIFESLNDDTLTTILEFVGGKSYGSFGGVNKQCKEVYLATKGMTKKTFLYGYGPLSAIKDRIESSEDMENDNSWKLLNAVGDGVVCYNRRDVMDWALEERNKFTLKGICTVAAKGERYDLLEEVFNGVEVWGEKEDVFEGVDVSAASFGRIDVIKWLETHQLDIDKENCAKIAACKGQVHILKWLREERGLKLFEYLYLCAIHHGHLNVLKWLREKGCPWYEYTFSFAARYTGFLDVLQWLHDEGCPWPEFLDISLSECEIKPGVLDWLRVNGYGNRISV